MQVESIAVAPVKGLGLVHPSSVDVTASGVRGDRRYAMVDDRDRLASGKRFGPLVRVSVVESDGSTLVLRLPDGSSVGGAVELGDELDAIFYGEPRRGRLVLGRYAEALSELAGEPLRLLQFPEGEAVDRAGDGAVSIQSTASLEAIGREAGVGAAVDGRRFRMTFTVSGAGEHDEDSWLGRRVRIGEAAVVPEGNIGRCAITTQDPETGVPTLDTLKTLARYRGELVTTEPLPFGVHARVLTPGRVSVGDQVVVDPA
ncbi:MAG: MOSC domain-containing protein [Candidatus Nanopelagicales bacterium]